MYTISILAISAMHITRVLKYKSSLTKNWRKKQNMQNLIHFIDSIPIEDDENDDGLIVTVIHAC